jgi:hypothetical protein
MGIPFGECHAALYEPGADCGALGFGVTEFRWGARWGTGARRAGYCTQAVLFLAWLCVFLGADEETRTPNLLFTKQLLCQLSYVGGWPRGARQPWVVVDLEESGCACC